MSAAHHRCICMCVTKVGTRNQGDIPVQLPTTVSVYDGPESLILPPCQPSPGSSNICVCDIFQGAHTPFTRPFILLWLWRFQVSQSASTPTSAFVLLQFLRESVLATRRLKKGFRDSSEGVVSGGTNIIKYGPLVEGVWIFVPYRSLEETRPQRKGPSCNRVGFLLAESTGLGLIARVRFTSVSPFTQLANSVEAKISRAERAYVTVKTCLSWPLV
ncbi:hypothetical protein B0H11DRAFT_2105604 [Mycena galericulata]|nr:hypothetical protein B0H11DRAFT_2105604 [Mycena galericulata]